MEWYFVVLIILGYFIIGGIVSGLYKRDFEQPVFGDLTMVIGFLWPIFIIPMLIIIISDWVSNI